MVQHVYGDGFGFSDTAFNDYIHYGLAYYNYYDVSSEIGNTNYYAYDNDGDSGSASGYDPTADTITVNLNRNNTKNESDIVRGNEETSEQTGEKPSYVQPFDYYVYNQYEDFINNINATQFFYNKAFSYKTNV